MRALTPFSRTALAAALIAPLVMFGGCAAIHEPPTVVPVPGWAPGLLLGARGSDELALADQKVLPTALTGLDHAFRHPDLRAALEHELGAEELPTAL